MLSWPCVQVTAFSRWERELPKLVGEPRFQGIGTMKERRTLFDGYCKAAPEINKRRAESKRAALEAFQALLAEATSLPGAQSCVHKLCQAFSRSLTADQWVNAGCICTLPHT